MKKPVILSICFFSLLLLFNEAAFGETPEAERLIITSEDGSRLIVTLEDGREIFVTIEDSGELIISIESDSEPAVEDDSRLQVSFNYGITNSWNTRIIYQTERSNFVHRDYLLGLYFTTEFDYYENITPLIRLALYYPMGFLMTGASTFNKFPQEPKSPLHFGIDLLLGLSFVTLDFKYVRINPGAGLHLLFLTSDRWNYLNPGLAGFAGIEVPLTRSWTVLFNGYFSFDNGNFGNNRLMEPFDIVYQYQFDIGVRYSKKNINHFSLFGPRGNETINR